MSAVRLEVVERQQNTAKVNGRASLSSERGSEKLEFIEGDLASHERFMMLLAERLAEAEDQIANLQTELQAEAQGRLEIQTELQGRLPAPPTPQTVRIQHRPAAYFFKLLVFKDKWLKNGVEPTGKRGEALLAAFRLLLPTPMVSGPEAEEAPDNCDAVSYVSLRGGICLTSLMHRWNDLLLWVHSNPMEWSYTRASRHDAFRDCLIADIAIPLHRELLMVEGVFTSCNPQCAAKHVAAAIESAWQPALLPMASHPDLLSLPAELPETVKLGLAEQWTRGRRDLQEIALPRCWDAVLSSGQGYMSCFADYSDVDGQLAFFEEGDSVSSCMKFSQEEKAMLQMAMHIDDVWIENPQVVASIEEKWPNLLR